MLGRKANNPPSQVPSFPGTRYASLPSATFNHGIIVSTGDRLLIDMSMFSGTTIVSACWAVNALQLPHLVFMHIIFTALAWYLPVPF